MWNSRVCGEEDADWEKGIRDITVSLSGRACPIKQQEAAFTNLTVEEAFKLVDKHKRKFGSIVRTKRYRCLSALLALSNATARRIDAN